MNGPISFSTMRVIGCPAAAATSIPQMPPSEVPTQATGRPIAASKCDSATT